MSLGLKVPRDRGGATISRLETGLEVTYELRWSDAFLIHSDTRTTRVGIGFGCLMLIIAAVPPYGNSLAVAAWGLLVIAFMLLALPLEGAYLYGTAGLVGRRISLRVDTHGVKGWPLSPDVDRTWASLRQARLIAGVLVLRFPSDFGSRRAWVGIPRRAMKDDDFEALRRWAQVKR